MRTLGLHGVTPNASNNSPTGASTQSLVFRSRARCRTRTPRCTPGRRWCPPTGLRGRRDRRGDRGDQGEDVCTAEEPRANARTAVRQGPGRQLRYAVRVGGSRHGDAVGGRGRFRPGSAAARRDSPPAARAGAALAARGRPRAARGPDRVSLRRPATRPGSTGASRSSPTPRRWPRPEIRYVDQGKQYPGPPERCRASAGPAPGGGTTRGSSAPTASTPRSDGGPRPVRRAWTTCARCATSEIANARLGTRPRDRADGRSGSARPGSRQHGRDGEVPDIVALVWRWTGDDCFRDEMYDFANATCATSPAASTPTVTAGRGPRQRRAGGHGPGEARQRGLLRRGLDEIADLAWSKGE